MMKKWLSVAAILALSACSGSEISVKTVQKAIEDAPHRRVCIPFQLSVTDVGEEQAEQATWLGSDEIKLLKRLPNGKRANEKAAKEMEILTGAGLYREEKTEKIGEGDAAVRYLVYRLTEKGQQHLMPHHHGQQLLCVADIKVDRILFHTEPAANAKGIIVSQVHYVAHAKAYGWAQKLLKNTAQQDVLSAQAERKMILAKTDDGWIDANRLRF